MASRPVAAVVAYGDCFGECHVEPHGAGNCGGDLSNLESVSKARPLMVLGENEDLRLPSKSPKCAAVQDAVSVTFETSALRVGRFRNCSITCTDTSGSTWCQRCILELFPVAAVKDWRWAYSRAWLSVSVPDAVAGLKVAGHGSCPCGSSV